jgi:hypothetical protein
VRAIILRRKSKASTNTKTTKRSKVEPLFFELVFVSFVAFVSFVWSAPLPRELRLWPASEQV